MPRSTTYRAWINMKSRCNNPKTPGWPRYGGRGIVVCDRWNGSFANFLADMGEKPSEFHSLDRINNDGNYEPTNCRWATDIEQRRNTSANHMVKIDGVEMSLTAAAELTGVKPNLAIQRIRRGTPVERALNPEPLPEGGRRLPEWIGATPDSPIPPRVKLRIRAKANSCCQSCGVRVRYGGQFDHRPALINGDENRESQIQFICKNCHAARTKTDVAEKSRSARKQASLAGFRNTRKPFYVPKPKPEPTQRTWYYDERGRLCASYLKPVQPNDADN
jgi:hypothetical protein